MRKLQIHIAKSHEEAEDYDIAQMRSMTLSERLEAAMKLQKRYYGENLVRVRDSGFAQIAFLKNKFQKL